MFKRFSEALVTGLILSCSSPAAFAQAPVEPTARVVKTAVGQWLEKFQPPGTIVVVHHEGKTDFFPFGEANRVRRIAVTPDSIFELASITKVFTTTSLAMEIEEGRKNASFRPGRQVFTRFA